LWLKNLGLLAIIFPQTGKNVNQSFTYKNQSFTYKNQSFTYKNQSLAAGTPCFLRLTEAVKYLKPLKGLKLKKKKKNF